MRVSDLPHQPFTRAFRSLKFKAAQQTIGRVPVGVGPHECPICYYQGRFIARHAVTGGRKGAQCPRCGALERHRIQCLVFDNLADRGKLHGTLLEIAPEPFSRRTLYPHFRSVITSDLLRTGVTLRSDLTCLPFPTGSFNVVVASHVLEHIPDADAAVSEIHRVLSSDGIAILPVPIVNTFTVEYATPNRFEDFHVRAPGPDFYDRYEKVFPSVERFRSGQFPDRHQVHLIEDRSVFPSERFADRHGSDAERHEDIVAVAFKQPRAQ